jgi:hypothetical protein
VKAGSLTEYEGPVDVVVQAAESAAWVVEAATIKRPETVFLTADLGGRIPHGSLHATKRDSSLRMTSKVFFLGL